MRLAYFGMPAALALAALLLAPAPADAGEFGRYSRRGFSRGFTGGVVRVGSRYLGRGLSRHARNRRFAARGYGGYGSYANWRLYRNRHTAHDPYSYGRCYWRGYYRPHLYCRKYTPRYSYYQSVHRAPYPGGYAATRYGLGYSRPLGWGYGGVGYGGVGYGGIYGGGAVVGAWVPGGGYREPLYGSRYGYRGPHAAYPGGAGPYGFYDPFGYRLLPAFNFAPILTRLTTVYTIDDPAFDGEEPETADGLPQPRTKPVGDRFLVDTD
ncbi:MAG: hypothetical protein ACYTGZ_02435 [Planctomycetota bacterium]|jgi:hypothetical protein